MPNLNMVLPSLLFLIRTKSPDKSPNTSLSSDTVEDKTHGMVLSLVIMSSSLIPVEVLELRLLLLLTHQLNSLYYPELNDS